ncbi:hypothetical protein HPB49_022686 [Dermacentor silvarum]|uniref:Uncharacterized protein n=1 Tax=Dermacentor silvarum TaxID=543639 RepID=A0ACB8D8A9_DERSI|nr:hypothetical protein HPB49_022686 [Dermacentor silvarum]
MSNPKAKKTQGEATRNRKRHKSTKVLEPMSKPLTDALSPKATTATTEARGMASSNSAGNASQADATQKGPAECEEAVAAVAGALAPWNSSGNRQGSYTGEPDLARPQPSIETDFLRVGPAPSELPLPTVTDPASAPPQAKNGHLQDNAPPSRDSRSRERLFLPGKATTSAVREQVQVSRPSDGCDEESAYPGGAVQSPQSAKSPLKGADTQTMVPTEAMCTSPETFVSTGALNAVASLDGKRARTQKSNREGGTGAKLPPARRESSAATAATSGMSATGPEGATDGLTTAQSIKHTANTAGYRRSKASLSRTLPPQLDESFYEKIAVIVSCFSINLLFRELTTLLLTWLTRKSPSLICGTFVVLVIVFATILPPRKNHAGAKTCETEDCLVHAILLKGGLNMSVDPCYDFSAYVCSRWTQKQAAFREKVYSAMDSLRYSWYHHLADTLRLGSLKLPVGKKPLAMYQMCMDDSSSAGKHLQSPLLDNFFMNLPSGWLIQTLDKSVSSVSLAVLLAYKWQAPFWLTVTVLDGDRSSSGRRCVVIRPGAYLPRFLIQHRIAAVAYGRYMKAYVTAYFSKDDVQVFNDTFIYAVRDMEADLLSQLNSVLSQKKQPAQLTFGELDATVPLHGSAARGGWLRNFQEAVSLQPRLTQEDHVLLSHIPLLETLAGLVAKYGDRMLTFLLVWEFVQLYTPLSDLSLLATRFGSKTRADVYRQVYCAHHVEASFKVLVLSLSVAAGFSAANRDHIDARFDGLVSVALEKVNASTWLDDQSKVRVADKLALVKKRMWPPESLLAEDALEAIYANVSDNESSVAEFWIKTRRIMREMNATSDYKDASRLPGNNFPLYIDYDYIFNSVEVATGVAAPPAYYRNGTAAMFYGGLGFLMAMQLVKSIDEEGLGWAAAESIVDSILSNSSRRAYHDRVLCLNGSGTKRVFPEIPALEIAYSALETSNLDEREHLALAPDLPEGKVFFLTICYMTCTAPGHSDPMAADCNKLAQNSEYFARVYHCPKGSRMNPHKKCSFFS